jgi:hypothetical protein
MCSGVVSVKFDAWSLQDGPHSSASADSELHAAPPVCESLVERDLFDAL